MRNLFILALFTLCSFAQADNRTPIPDLPDFHAVKISGKFDVDITVGPKHTVVYKGKEKELKAISVGVVNGELQLKGAEEKSIFSKDKKFVITMPSIRSFQGKGVGEVEIEHIHGDEMDISYEGAGSLEASGHVKSLHVTAKGIGEIDTEDLHAENADINLQGVGEAKVFASKKLNATVKGVGALTYYGNPETVNKSGEGVGVIRSAH